MRELDAEAFDCLKTSAGRMCFVMATNYINAAEGQLDRMIANQARLDALEGRLRESSEDPDWQAEVQKGMLLQFMDVHFYVICLDKLHKLLKQIADAEGRPALDAAWLDVSSALSVFRDARNEFEHMEERFDRIGPGFGTFSPTTWSFQNRDYPIGAESYRRVTVAFDGFAVAIQSLPSA